MSIVMKISKYVIETEHDEKRKKKTFKIENNFTKNMLFLPTSFRKLSESGQG